MLPNLNLFIFGLSVMTVEFNTTDAQPTAILATWAVKRCLLMFHSKYY